MDIAEQCFNTLQTSQQALIDSKMASAAARSAFNCLIVSRESLAHQEVVSNCLSLLNAMNGYYDRNQVSEPCWAHAVSRLVVILRDVIVSAPLTHSLGLLGTEANRLLGRVTSQPETYNFGKRVFPPEQSVHPGPLTLPLGVQCRQVHSGTPFFVDYKSMEILREDPRSDRNRALLEVDEENEGEPVSGRYGQELDSAGSTILLLPTTSRLM